MSTSDSNRTHEPSLREVTAELDGLREWARAELGSMEKIMDERHERYGERAQSAEKSVEASFTASKDAIVKAEEAQKAYNVTHNDLSRKMDAQYNTMMPRTEAEKGMQVQVDKIEELKREVSKNRDEGLRDLQLTRSDLMKEISSLRESRSEGAGEKASRAIGIEQRNWGIYMLVIAFLGVADLVVSIIAIATVKH